METRILIAFKDLFKFSAAFLSEYFFLHLENQLFDQFEAPYVELIIFYLFPKTKI